MAGAGVPRVGGCLCHQSRTQNHQSVGAEDPQQVFPGPSDLGSLDVALTPEMAPLKLSLCPQDTLSHASEPVVSKRPSL